MDIKTFWLNYLKNPGNTLSNHFTAVNLTLLTITLILAGIITVIIECIKYSTKEEDYTEQKSYADSLGWTAIAFGFTFVILAIIMWMSVVGVYTAFHAGVYILLTLLSKSSAWIGFKWAWPFMFVLLLVLIDTALLHRKNYPQWLKLVFNISITILTVAWPLITLQIFNTPNTISFITIGIIIGFIDFIIVALFSDDSEDNDKSTDNQDDNKDTKENTDDDKDEGMPGYNQYGRHD